MNNPPFEIGLSVRARRDLSQIKRYYKEVASPTVAQNVYNRLIEAMETLAEWPERYPPEPLLVKHGNFRVLRVKKLPYKIFYHFSGDDIVIVRVLHSKRDLKRILSRFKH
jgi:toxin ParE1/3/4